MSFEVSIGQASPAESYFSGSVISGEVFTVNVKALDSNGNVDSLYNGTATIYANSAVSLTGYSIGTVSFTMGLGSATVNTPIRSVIGTESFRTVTVQDTNGNSGSIDVGVWFKVTMTVECSNDTSAAVGYDTSDPSHFVGCLSYQLYGIQNFVALPDPSACKANVAVYSYTSGTSVTVPVWDVGPFITNDPYWNGTGVPQNTQNNNAGIDGSDGTWNQLGLSNYYSCNYNNPSGNTTVLWRFS